MVARLFVSIALIVLGAGFLWFAGNVIYLGVKEIFKQKNESSTSKSASTTPTTAAASTTASTTTP